MDFMLALAGILLLAILFLYISQVVKLPSIVSFLVIGMLAGPYGLGLITDESSIETVGSGSCSCSSPSGSSSRSTSSSNRGGRSSSAAS